MKYAKRFLSIALALSMLGACFAAVPVTAVAEDSTQMRLTASIQLGDYVEMGTYDTDGDGTAEPILWRCVAFEKIKGYDDNGNPITDSTDTKTEYEKGYLPLMFADKAICQKEFDAAGNNTSGSHGRDSGRTTEGSNYWSESNIQDWLNSGNETVTYTCGNPPNYSDESGFLTNFTVAEKAAIKLLRKSRSLRIMTKILIK